MSPDSLQAVCDRWARALAHWQARHKKRQALAPGTRPLILGVEHPSSRLGSTSELFEDKIEEFLKKVTRSPRTIPHTLSFSRPNPTLPLPPTSPRTV